MGPGQGPTLQLLSTLGSADLSVNEGNGHTIAMPVQILERVARIGRGHHRAATKPREMPPVRVSRSPLAFVATAFASIAFVATIVITTFGSPARAASDATPAARIVSLIPSLTEDLFAIGAGDRVVGVSQFTDYPPAATRLPTVASFTSLDAERIVRLHPDLVVGIPAQAILAGDLRRLGTRVEFLPDDSFDDLFRTLDRLGRLTGRRAQASALAAALRARTARLVATVPRGPRPRAFVVLGVAPIFTVGDGSYIAHLIALAGGRNASGVRDAYARFSAEALLAAQPDAIVADKTSGIDRALGTPPWNALRAVRAGRVYVLDDAAILERPGPRYNEGLAWLIDRLHRGAR